VTFSIIQDSSSYDPSVSGHVVLNGVSVTAGIDHSNGTQRMVSLNGPDLQLLNSKLFPSANTAFSVTWADGALLSGNTLNTRSAYYIFTSSQNQIFENNTITNPNLDANAASEGGGGSISLAFCGPCRSQINRNFYFGYNSTSNVTNLGTQGITTDGSNIAYYGKVSGASGNQITLSYQPDWSKVGNSNFQTLILSIIAGTGTGQYEFLQAANGSLLQLVSPFAVQPDATSVVVLTQTHHNLIVAHNSFNAILSQSILVYGDAREVAIENNAMENGGQGIGVFAPAPYAPMDYEPNFNVEVLNNQITGTPGNPYFPTTAAVSTGGEGAGFTLNTPQGAGLSGLLVRGNTIQGPQAFKWGDGQQNVTSLLEENNVGTQLGGIHGASTALSAAVLLESVNY
jgi:hypothetical protein